MADNVQFQTVTPVYPPTTPLNVAADDIAGAWHQRVKLSVGADGAASDAVPVSNGMDVTGAAVQAVGLVAQLDDTSPSAVTENQFGPLRMSSRRAVLVEQLGVPNAAITTQADQNTNATLIAANAKRRRVIIVNDSTEILYVKYGATATTDDWTRRLQAGEEMQEDVYTGQIDGIWAANASGKARVTEITA